MREEKRARREAGGGWRSREKEEGRGKLMPQRRRSGKEQERSGKERGWGEWRKKGGGRREEEGERKYGEWR
eukprot:2355591-Rhodomonas_salina.2